MGTNRDRALDAALRIVGTEGIRALTHGRVDAAAGLPKGSTSNYFRTRAALVHASVGRLVAAEQEAFAEAGRPHSAEDLVEALVASVRESTEARRVLTAARFAFFVEGFHDDEVRQALADARGRIEGWAAETLAGLGFPHPFVAARRILAHVEGVMLHRMTFGGERADAEDIQAVVAAVLADAG